MEGAESALVGPGGGVAQEGPCLLRPPGVDEEHRAGVAHRPMNEWRGTGRSSEKPLVTATALVRERARESADSSAEERNLATHPEPRRRKREAFEGLGF